MTAMLRSHLGNRQANPWSGLPNLRARDCIFSRSGRAEISFPPFHFARAMHIHGMEESSGNTAASVAVEKAVGTLREKVGMAKPRGVTRKRKRFALVVAALVDGVQLFPGAIPFTIEGFLSPFVDGLDAVAAIALLLILGFQWRLLLSLAAELVPGLTLFPTWTAVVLSIPVDDTIVDGPRNTGGLSDPTPTSGL